MLLITVASRNERWAKAFSSTNDSSPDNINLKVTIVVEHLIQASDVSHTMQHVSIDDEKGLLVAH